MTNAKEYGIIERRTTAVEQRIPIFCKRGQQQLLARVDTRCLEALALLEGGAYLWCRGCHREHYILWKDIARREIKQVPGLGH